jgi:predicted negative regulator of RcsB-dependent stress response
MKSSKDFKQEVNQEFKEFDYVGRRVGIRAIVITLILVVICSVGGVGYKKWKTDQDRKIFKQSATYNEGVLDDLAKYKYELETSKDKTDKSAIAQLVNDRFANYDTSKIENQSLRQFLYDCQNGVYSK